MKRFAVLGFALGCAGPEGEIRRPGDPEDSGWTQDSDEAADSDPALDSDPGDSGADSDTADPDTADTGEPGPCPPDMALVGTLCVDRYEGSLQVWEGGRWVPHVPYNRPAGGKRYRAVPARDAVPQGYLSADEAAAACGEAGKRLCTSAEWLRVCRGAADRTFPYGNTYDPAACNDTYGGSHPVVDYFGTSEGVWTGAKMNDPGINQQPGTLTRGGEMARCASEDGVMDLHGNLHEWVADAEGTFRGGFYADAKINGVGCGYVTTAHSRPYHDYSTGFRCCADGR
jgi:hypothetical protein